jgi:hypothetical protein
MKLVLYKGPNSLSYIQWVVPFLQNRGDMIDVDCEHRAEHMNIYTVCLECGAVVITVL